MHRIKFGTDGWRAIIGASFTVENVQRISSGVCRWMLDQQMETLVIGRDTRFGGDLFLGAAACVFAAGGIKVLTDKDFVTTPMISLATLHLKTDLGVVITASHNPPSYNGYKLKGKHGGPALQDELNAIEKLIPDKAPKIDETFDFFVRSGQIEYIDLEELYLKNLEKHFDLPSLRNMGPSIAYDSMFGAGKKIMRRLFPSATHLHHQDNPGFLSIPPEPIDRNLSELEELMKERADLKIGIANDGDADRIGLYDEYGQFIDSHHILLLLLHYLFQEKKEKGKVLASAAVTEKLEILAQNYGLDFDYTKIGFKHITPRMLKEDILLAGEEAGGMAVRHHLPERDGVFISLMILEFMQKSGKSLAELVDDLYGEVGAFAYNRVDLHLSEKEKQRIVALCMQNKIEAIAGLDVEKVQKVDGFRYFLGNSKWLMIRPSGTEPVLRFYAQAESKTAVDELLKTAVKELTEKE
jgi:phosphomannomutase